jgi:hypothetical protein
LRVLKRNYVLELILLLVISSSLSAKDFDIKEQRDFFCKLEKYDNCFFTGKCLKQDYINYTDYFSRMTEINSNWVNDLYKYIPKIYKVKEYDKKSKIIIYDGFQLSELSISYIFAKSDWLFWYKHKTGISHKYPQNIFANNRECGSKTFNKYLSLPLPQDADLQTCFFNYQISNSKCVPDDKEFRKKIFCRSVQECEIIFQ